MLSPDMGRLKQLEDENSKLRELVANFSPDDVISEDCDALARYGL